VADGPFRVGLVTGADPRRVAALEAMPVDSLWVGGHIAAPSGAPEAMVGLARLSAVTERVSIGTSILLLPLYPPAIVAKQIADIDRASGGRVIFGVGVGGEFPEEFRACEVPVEERGRRTDEAIPLLRQFWSAQPVSHTGRFHAMDRVRIQPAPAQPGGPPIVVAGRREAAMRRAATLGDGWFPYLYSARRYAASVRTIQDIAAVEGRDLDGFGWYAWIFLNIDADGAAARQGLARSLAGTYQQDFDAMADRVGVAGTVPEVVDKLKAFVDAGARHFVFSPAVGGGDPDRVVRRLIDEVVPEIRAHADAPGDRAAGRRTA
jgi:probable F420-dependent oxidoreductase